MNGGQRPATGGAKDSIIRCIQLQQGTEMIHSLTKRSFIVHDRDTEAREHSKKKAKRFYHSRRGQVQALIRNSYTGFGESVYLRHGGGQERTETRSGPRGGGRGGQRRWPTAPPGPLTQENPIRWGEEQAQKKRRRARGAEATPLGPAGAAATSKGDGERRRRRS
ncbi:hypothetical protein BU14_0125s0053 [Porphyra umbilicalis]|uniref:Uncharacterized protein n=1 Tax=Porphyra umbilicalis TaxID=2786 RepID=A0A1X6PBE3_PORUM|nr:hypothetical protein BU14_0125s0053 [Porphyra umbilicalis]|eukprot:OSX78065.1 hypothetical protein BU14_0125s0053 [Porphyra umbilicalis]